MKGLGLSLMLAAGVLLVSPEARAAEGECNGGFCGTPRQVGGGGCGCGGGAILINNTDMGETYSTSDDFDTDGYEDDFDNCPFISNRDQADGDGDQVGDGCDNAPSISNPDQFDIDGDGRGDVIDDDIDGDSFLNPADNCPNVYNSSQLKTLASATLGDACNTDDDGDGLLDAQDPCPKLAGNVTGAQCFSDEDLDSVSDEQDNCPGRANDDQANRNATALGPNGIANQLGDACDPDLDGDSVLNSLDNAISDFNPDQLDSDRDGLGDVADSLFCYVFDGAAWTAAAEAGKPGPCLDPTDAFRVGAIAYVKNIEKHEVGKPVALKLFANREGAPIAYDWAVTGRPDGSEATVANARGKVVDSDGFEYRYQTNAVPTFTPDQEGQYKIEVKAELVFGDEVLGPAGPTTARYATSLRAEGEGESSGCSTSAGASAGALLMLGALLLRRRK